MVRKIFNGSNPSYPVYPVLGPGRSYVPEGNPVKKYSPLPLGLEAGPSSQGSYAEASRVGNVSADCQVTAGSVLVAVGDPALGKIIR